MKYLPRLAAVCVFFQALTASAAESIVLEHVESEAHNFRVVRVVDGLEHPWAIEFLPDDSLLITERPGRLQHFRNGRLTEIQGLPEITARGQGGLMDIIKHPRFAENQLIYFTGIP